MKKIALLSVLVIFLFSCKKDNPATPATPVSVTDSVRVSLTVVKMGSTDSVWYDFTTGNTSGASALSKGYKPNVSYTWKYTLTNETLFDASFEAENGVDSLNCKIWVNGSLISNTKADGIIPLIEVNL